jgi:hypothetical protein
MAVNGMGGYNYKNLNDYTTSKKASDKKDAGEETAKAGSEKAAETKTPPKAETYKPDMDKINAMKADLANNIAAFKQMVFAQVKGQGNMADRAGGINIQELLKNISPEEAKANIAEDGYWGVEQTANRILDFAKALSGGDPSKIELLKNAVLKGFDAAEKIWGGKLPSISYETKQKVLEGFDAWANEGAGVEA